MTGVVSFPHRLDRLDPGAYRAQALVDLDDTRRDFNAGPGNLHSRAVPCELRGSHGGGVNLTFQQLNRLVLPPAEVANPGR